MIMQTRQVAAVLAVGGAGLVSFAVVHFLTHEINTVPTLHIASNLAVAGGGGIGLVYVGYWLSDQSFSPARNRRILVLTAIGAVTLLAVFVITQPLAQEQVTAEELLHIVQVSLGIGSALGAAVGAFEARALTRAEEATRAESRLAALEDERERWSELTTVFRHYVNNSVTVINFALDELRSTVDGDAVELDTASANIETVADRVRTIETVAEHVDRLGPAAGIDHPSPVANVCNVTERASRLASVDAAVTVATLEAGPDVLAGESVEQDLALLLEALGSVTEEGGRIDCECEPDDGRVVVRFTATPATLPPEVEAALFEPVTRKSGLKLYLAERSIDAYADLRLATNGERTVAFEVVFDVTPE
ncbi:Signal transduction histidine kinase and PAS domains [Halorhabdus sp. SVX81]|nr:Signal transduction histidine kinase and PAS domains [Halorhabdus sp. SVX81]